MKKINITPFVKWAGGKRQLLPKIVQYIPPYSGKYIEPFVGGGALLFALCPTHAIVGDINSDLICAYTCLSSSSLYPLFLQKLNQLQKKHSEPFYLKESRMDREPSYLEKSPIERGARLIYLNKTGFNGLYRVNSNGFYNVPSSKRKNINLYSKENLDHINNYLVSNQIVFYCQDYKTTLLSAEKGDFIFLDPPYDIPKRRKTEFTAYSAQGFGAKQQEELCNEFKRLDLLGAKVLLCNGYTSNVKKLYAGYKMVIVDVIRYIKPPRGSTKRDHYKEMLIMNY